MNSKFKSPTHIVKKIKFNTLLSIEQMENETLLKKSYKFETNIFSNILQFFIPISQLIKNCYREIVKVILVKLQILQTYMYK